jgi:hypothetical protein
VIRVQRNDKALVVGFAVIALPLPVLFGWWYGQWSWWLLLFGLALLANAAILGLRLQLRTEQLKLWKIAAVEPINRAVSETRNVLYYLFPTSEDLREMFRKDLTLAAEQEGNGEYGRRLRSAFRADGTENSP